MANRGETWAVVLAGGYGTRLSSLTTDAEGVVIPKQFCSLDGRRSLLQVAIEQTEAHVPRERVIAVVAAEHRRWWEPQVAALKEENVVVQPCSRDGRTTKLTRIIRPCSAARDTTQRWVMVRPGASQSPSGHLARQTAGVPRARDPWLLHTAGGLTTRRRAGYRRRQRHQTVGQTGARPRPVSACRPGSGRPTPC